MKHIILTFIFTGIIAVLAYYTLTHPNRDRVKRLDMELIKLRHKNEKLDSQNAKLRRKVVALRDDPRLAERRARESARLAKPDELIFEFQSATTPQHVQVKLEVNAHGPTLAGRKVTLKKLGDALHTLHQQVPGAHLTVFFTPEVSALERQRVRDTLGASSLKSIAYKDPS